MDGSPSPERYLGSRGINLIGPASERDAIAAKLASAGSVAIDGGTFDAIRVSSRIPTHPAELNEERNPWEARLDGSISLVKGCYIGQEVVARLDTYKKVHRSLVHLDLDGDALPAVRAPVVHEGRDVGYVSSAVVNPRTGRVEALGYLLGDLAEPGKIVTVGGASGRVDPVEPWAKAQGA
ncbi:MAG: glycine cleavage T C-terminal barrel domain-containing protein [Acidobacteriota bacterium]